MPNRYNLDDFGEIRGPSGTFPSVSPGSLSALRVIAHAPVGAYPYCGRVSRYDTCICTNRGSCQEALTALV